MAWRFYRRWMGWLLVVGAGLAALARAIAFPRVDEAETCDAVVALDGDRPRRVRAAVALAAAGVAPVLVVVRAENAAPELIAHAPELPFELLSFTPDPPTTRGEARAIAGLTAEHGWRRIVVVTSTYHLTRARLIFARAVGCELRFVSAGMQRDQLPRSILSETAKLLLATTLRRS